MCQSPHQINMWQRLHSYQLWAAYSSFEHTPGEPSLDLAIENEYSPLAAELHHRQSFAGRITLFQSNWKVLTSDPWVLETVIQGYHFPLTAIPGQKPWPYTPHLPTRELALLEEEIQTLVRKQAVQEVPITKKGIFLKHVHSAKEGWGSETCHQPQISKQICEITAFQDGRPTHSKGPITEERLNEWPK